MLYRLGSADLGDRIVFRCVLLCILNVTINKLDLTFDRLYILYDS